MAKKKQDEDNKLPMTLDEFEAQQAHRLRGALVPIEDEHRLRESDGVVRPPEVLLRPEVGEVRVPFDDNRKQRYIEYLSMYGVKHKCAKAVGVAPYTVLKAKKADPEFAEACELALEVFRDSLEETIIDRAVHGWVEPVVSGGSIVGYVKKFDNRLLELLLKRHIPAYRDKQQLDVNVNGGVMLAPAPMSSPEEWQNKHALPENTERDALGEELKKVVVNEAAGQKEEA